MSRQWLAADDVILLVVVTGGEKGGNILMQGHVRFSFKIITPHVGNVC